MKPFNVLCPFHNERTPSCRIWFGGGFFCHGCHAKGKVQDHPSLLSLYDKEHAKYLRECTKHLEDMGQLLLPFPTNIMEE